MYRRKSGPKCVTLWFCYIFMVYFINPSILCRKDHPSSVSKIYRTSDGYSIIPVIQLECLSLLLKNCDEQTVYVQYGIRQRPIRTKFSRNFSPCPGMYKKSITGFVDHVWNKSSIYKLTKQLYPCTKLVTSTVRLKEFSYNPSGREIIVYLQA